MKWASEPSRYRYCMRRTSVLTERNFSPALNVRSITLPSEARRSLVRTKAPPLPGLTCWNSRILKTVPSTSMWLPFLNWLVEIAMERLALEPDFDAMWCHRPGQVALYDSGGLCHLLILATAPRAA